MEITSPKLSLIPLLILAKPLINPRLLFFTNYTQHAGRIWTTISSCGLDFLLLLFFYVSFILLFTLMVCCDGNSLVKIRRNGKQRMEESDHQATDKGGLFSFMPYIVSRAQ